MPVQTRHPYAGVDQSLERGVVRTDDGNGRLAVLDQHEVDFRSEVVGEHIDDGPRDTDVPKLRLRIVKVRKRHIENRRQPTVSRVLDVFDIRPRFSVWGDPEPALHGDGRSDGKGLADSVEKLDGTRLVAKDERHPFPAEVHDRAGDAEAKILLSGLEKFLQFGNGGDIRPGACGKCRQQECQQDDEMTVG